MTCARSIHSTLLAFKVGLRSAACPRRWWIKKQYLHPDLWRLCVSDGYQIIDGFYLWTLKMSVKTSTDVIKNPQKCRGEVKMYISNLSQGKCKLRDSGLRLNWLPAESRHEAEIYESSSRAGRACTCAREWSMGHWRVEQSSLIYHYFLMLAIDFCILHQLSVNRTINVTIIFGFDWLAASVCYNSSQKNKPLWFHPADFWLPD